MRLFAKVAEVASFTGAARQLGVPKQTLSRRVAELERALGVQLLHRTTRRLRLTDVGAAYALRCAQIVRLADETNRAASDADEVPRGVLRVTADPLFGQAFLTGLVIDYAKKWPEVRLEIALTRRRVDLIEEGFDLAFRIGEVDEPSLSGTRLGPARVRYCASPRYVERRGNPEVPEQLREHDCVLVSADGAAVRWPFSGPAGPRLVAVEGRHVFSSFAMAHAAALEGLGIAIFPEFACAHDVATGRLVPVLGASCVDVGSIWLVHPARRFSSARVRAFIELAHARFDADARWLEPSSVSAPGARPGKRRTGRRR